MGGANAMSNLSTIVGTAFLVAVVSALLLVALTPVGVSAPTGAPRATYQHV
jgi:hypothetical protein